MSKGTEEKATPGPWTVHQNLSNEVPECLEIWAPTRFAPVRKWIAKMVGSTNLGLSNRANADLVAASPDLYAVLKRLEWRPSYFGGEPRDVCPVCERLRPGYDGLPRVLVEWSGHAADCTLAAALRKAEGGAA